METKTLKCADCGATENLINLQVWKRNGIHICPDCHKKRVFKFLDKLAKQQQAQAKGDTNHDQTTKS